MSELKEFQSEVFKRYKSLKQEFDDAVLFSEKGAAALMKNPKQRFVKRQISKILTILRIKLHNIYVKSKPFVEIERKAEAIIENPKIKGILGESFKKKISPDFFKEELEVEVIITLTASLTKQNILEEFSIKKEKLLFSLMTYKILQKGIEKYCSG
jgi:hypothetical protein